jgi:hypothetical protein
MSLRNHGGAARCRDSQLCEAPMNHETMQEIQIDPTGLPVEVTEDDFETIGDYHRRAAHYFTEAAKQHLAAAAADDDGDDASVELHAYKAYRHQLNGVQCAEIATMESEEDDGDAEYESKLGMATAA